MSLKAVISCAVVAVLAMTSQRVQAQELQLPETRLLVPNQQVATTSDVVAVGYVTPTYGTMTLGMPALTLGSSNLRQPTGFNSNFTAQLHGASVGVFGQFSGRPAILAFPPTNAWNLGASVGYAGFYLRGALNELPQVAMLLRGQSWQAGFGYETGALDLRLTYMAASQNSSMLAVSEPVLDSKQWTLGGIYQISSRVSLNADAFYSVRDSHGTRFSMPIASQQAPQGTGARVGIQLRF